MKRSRSLTKHPRYDKLVRPTRNPVVEDLIKHLKKSEDPDVRDLIERAYCKLFMSITQNLSLLEYPMYREEDKLCSFLADEFIRIQDEVIDILAFLSECKHRNIADFFIVNVVYRNICNLTYDYYYGDWKSGDIKILLEIRRNIIDWEIQYPPLKRFLEATQNNS